MELLLRKNELLLGPNSATVACYNGRRNFVLSGSTKDLAAIEAIAEGVSGMEINLAKLKVTHAFHSALTDPILEKLSTIAQSVSFKDPLLKLELCSPDFSNTETDAKALLNRTRMPVHLFDAVRRIQDRLGSAIWLDAGCGSSIVQMTQKALANNNNFTHSFRYLNLAASDAHDNLARVTNELWSLGSDVQFWHFHKIQQDSYLTLYLPQYQFKRTKNWIPCKLGRGNADMLPSESVEEQHDLLRQVPS